MLPSPIRYFLLSSCLLYLAGCAPAYTNMLPATANPAALNKFKPRFTVAWYNTMVNIMGHHLSGLLLIKTMPDSSTRIVFSNEMGFKFFDFEFSATGKFKVFSIIKQLDKKAVIVTLQKDFELILMQKINTENVLIRKDAASLYFIYPQTKGYYFYITDTLENKLLRMERASNKKTVVVATMQNYFNSMPDTIGITHNKFNFTIGLKRIIK